MTISLLKSKVFAVNQQNNKILVKVQIIHVCKCGCSDRHHFLHLCVYCSCGWPQGDPAERMMFKKKKKEREKHKYTETHLNNIHNRIKTLPNKSLAPKD